MAATIAAAIGPLSAPASASIRPPTSAAPDVRNASASTAAYWGSVRLWALARLISSPVVPATPMLNALAAIRAGLCSSRTRGSAAAISLTISHVRSVDPPSTTATSMRSDG